MLFFLLCHNTAKPLGEKKAALCIPNSPGNMIPLECPPLLYASNTYANAFLFTQKPLFLFHLYRLTFPAKLPLLPAGFTGLEVASCLGGCCNAACVVAEAAAAALFLEGRGGLAPATWAMAWTWLEKSPPMILWNRMLWSDSMLCLSLHCQLRYTPSPTSPQKRQDIRIERLTPTHAPYEPPTSAPVHLYSPPESWVNAPP